MALKFDRELTPAAVEAAPAEPVLELKPYDIMEDKRAVVAKLAGSDEIEDLTATIDVHDLTTIATFGSKTAEDISKASDVVLRSMSVAQLNESGDMLRTLARIMDQFNLNEIQDNPGLLGRLFGNARKQLDRILDKYHTMGDEVDRIYVQLRRYEEEIKQSNRKLETMFEANVGYFHELEKYIVAGEQGCREIEAYMGQLREEMERTGDQSISFELVTLQQALTMLEQRTQDLRIAETVALQSIPMIKTMEFTNMNLVRKINSAFIVTLPVFKQALAQAILLKRQRIQAEAMSELDRRTNEMLLRNARNTADSVKASAKLAAGSGVKADTLETAWRTIVKGIDETRTLQDSARAQREQDQAKLEQIKRDFMARGGKGL